MAVLGRPELGPDGFPLHPNAPATGPETLVIDHVEKMPTEN
jgi:hypothetical protein